MPSNRILTLLAAGCCLFGARFTISAQALVERAVLAAGGGSASGGPVSLTDTMGQPCIGSATSANYSIAAGFWGTYAPPLAAYSLGIADFPNQSVAIPLARLLAGSDGDDALLAVVAADAASLQGGAVVLSSSNLVYTAPGSLTGTDNFTYTIRNADGDTAVGTITITRQSYASSVALLASANPALPESAVTFTAIVSAQDPVTNSPTGQVQFLTNGVAAGGLVPLTNGVAIYSTTNLLHGTNLVTAQYGGDDFFGGGSAVVAELINAPPVAAPAVYYRFGDASVLISINDLLLHAWDAEGDIVSFVSAGPASSNGGSITMTNGSLLYTPPANNGNVTDRFSYTVQDQFAATSTGSITVNILPENNGQVLFMTGANRLADGTMLVKFAGSPGPTYLIQATTNLQQPTWITLATNSAGASGLFQFIDPDAANYGRRFYRATTP